MPGNLQSIERAAAVVRLLAASTEPLPLGDIAQMLRLPKSTTHGIVRTLVMVGWVKQDASTKRYGLASSMSGWDPPQLDVNELRSRAMNWIDTLAARTRLDCRLLVLTPGSGSDKDPGAALVAQHVIRPDSHSALPDSADTADTTDSVPLYATSGGKVLLAFDPRGAQLVKTIPLQALAFRTTTSRPDLRAELAEIRKQAFAVDREEWHSGFGGLAAPVCSHGGIAIGALMVGGRVDDIFATNSKPLAGVLAALRHSASGITQAICAERG
jgi:DNA-binding IclR family transcriptional regulator